MHRMIKLVLASAVLAGSAAHAQTYNLDVDLGITQTDPFNFAGTFALNQNGTFSNVDVHDPFDGGTFNAATITQLGGGKEMVTLYDTGGRTGPTSMMYTLSFDVNEPLGGSTKTFGVSDVLFNIDYNFVYQCGAGRPGFTVSCEGNVSTQAVTPQAITSAPEIDLRFAAEGFFLLVGGLVVLRSRRSSKTPARLS